MSKGLIGGLAAVVGVLALATVGVLMASGDDSRRSAAISSSKTFVSGKSVLYEGTKLLGFLQSSEGCDTHGNVVDEPASVGQVVTRKHVGVPVYEPCVIRFGADMDPAIFSWMQDMLEQKSGPKTLSIVDTDFNYKAQSGIELTNATISKVTLPALDQQESKKAFVFELTLQPEVTRSIQPVSSTVSAGSKTTKAALAANFKVSLSGLPKTEGVAKVSSWSATQKASEAAVGETRTLQKSPPTVSLGTIDLSVLPAKSSEFDTWFDDFLIKGKNAQTDEKTLTIDLYDQSLKNVVMTYSFKGVGIFRAALGRNDGSEKLRTNTYSLYVEEAVLPFAKAAAPPPPPPPPPPPETGKTETAPAETEPAETKPIETVPTEREQALAGPASLKASTAGESEAELAWAPVEGAEEYVILASQERGGPYDELGRSKETGTIASGLKSGVTYYFVVRGVVKDTETADSPEAEAIAG